MALNFKEKLASVILIAGFATLISYFNPSCNLNLYQEDKKIITLNNKEYLGRRTDGLIGSKNYMFVSPPIDISIPPRPGMSFGFYRGNKDANVKLYDYAEYENDALVKEVKDENDPEFYARKDTLEKLIEIFKSGK